MILKQLKQHFIAFYCSLKDNVLVKYELSAVFSWVIRWNHSNFHSHVAPFLSSLSKVSIHFLFNNFTRFFRPNFPCQIYAIQHQIFSVFEWILSDTIKSKNADKNNSNWTNFRARVSSTDVAEWHLCAWSLHLCSRWTVLDRVRLIISRNLLNLIKKLH